MVLVSKGIFPMGLHVMKAIKRFDILHYNDPRSQWCKDHLVDSTKFSQGNINRSIDVGFFCRINHGYNYSCMIYVITIIFVLFIYVTIMLNFNNSHIIS